MLNIENAMQLKLSRDLLRAAKEAEQRNCEKEVIRRLYALYYAAVEKEEGRGRHAL